MSVGKERVAEKSSAKAAELVDIQGGFRGARWTFFV